MRSYYIHITSYGIETFCFFSKVFESCIGSVTVRVLATDLVTFVQYVRQRHMSYGACSQVIRVTWPKAKRRQLARNEVNNFGEGIS